MDASTLGGGEAVMPACNDNKPIQWALQTKRATAGPQQRRLRQKGVQNAHQYSTSQLTSATPT